MYRKCVTVQPFQVENNHTTGMKMKTFTYCLILVTGSSIHTKSSVQTWDTQQSPHFFFCTVRAGLFHCSWSELAPSLGTRYLVWSPLISWILSKGPSSSSVWKELLQTWAWACFVQTQNIISLFLKAPAWNRSMQPLPGHPQHREGMSPWGIY